MEQWYLLDSKVNAKLKTKSLTKDEGKEKD